MRELVLTGLPELWPADERAAVFLGPWCFAHNSKYRFEQYVEFNMAPGPGRSLDDLVSASRYIDSVCDRILPGLCDLLNDLHDVQHSRRFWKIVTINWLVHWVGVCYDRYQRFCCLQEDWVGKETLRVRTMEANTVCPRDWQEYNRHISDHVYNLQLMSDVLRGSEQFGFLDTSLADVRLSDLPRREPRIRHPGKPSSLGDHFRVFLDGTLGRLASAVLPRMDPPCLLGTIPGIERLDKLRIQLALDPLALLKLKPKTDGGLPRIKERCRLLELPFTLDCRSPFEQTLEQMLCAHVPDSFLSYYPAVGAVCHRRQTWIGNELHGSIERVYRIAHLVEQGGRWISMQHGGGYGQVQVVGVDKIEYETPAAFITWGWSEPQSPAAAFHPLPCPMLCKLPARRLDGDSILFVGTMLPAYHYRFHSVPQPEHLLEYLQWKERFLRHIDDSLHNKVLYRPYIHDYGMDEVAHVTRAVPTCTIMDSKPLVGRLRGARLAVVDHLATSLLVSMAMDVPTILFWDPAVYALTDSAKPFFDDLRSVGILFDTPEAAAEKVNEVWADVPAWWQRGEVQCARGRFCRRFALRDKHWRRIWTDFVGTHLH